MYYDKNGQRKPCCILTVDEDLSIKSDNPISNKGITSAIVNDMEQVKYITKKNIPCGTLIAKELDKRISKLEKLINK